MRRNRRRTTTTDSRPGPPLPGAAHAGGLLYTTDRKPGFRRVSRGKHFIYLHPDGRRVSAPALLARFRQLAIPPAYENVWICPHANGHLQATARDARGRKQYRYHPRWREQRDTTKFERMLDFGRALPRIRAHVARDLRARKGLPREKVLATILRLLECTAVRVGNEEYVRQNGSYGLTTLRNRHVELRGGTVMLEFRGKSGVAQRVSISDRAVARIVRGCRDIPGQELFQWIDSRGGRHPIGSQDVNDYLREASGGDFTAKDFRTWFATLEALELLRSQRARTRTEARRQVLDAVKAVAHKLGNTPATCRKCYIHPAVLSAHAEGKLTPLNEMPAPRALRALLAPTRRRRRMSPTLRIKLSAARSPRSPTAIPRAVS